MRRGCEKEKEKEREEGLILGAKSREGRVGGTEEKDERERDCEQEKDKE